MIKYWDQNMLMLVKYYKMRKRERIMIFLCIQSDLKEKVEIFFQPNFSNQSKDHF